MHHFQLTKLRQSRSQSYTLHHTDRKWHIWDLSSNNLAPGPRKEQVSPALPRSQPSVSETSGLTSCCGVWTRSCQPSKPSHTQDRLPAVPSKNLHCCMVQGPLTMYLKCCLSVSSCQCSYSLGENDYPFHRHTPHLL